MKYEAAHLFPTFIIIRNVSWAANQHIRVISEGSCDTEDCCNDASNSALITEINYIFKYITIETSILNCNNISPFLLCFWSNKRSLGEQKSLLSYFLISSKLPVRICACLIIRQDYVCERRKNICLTAFTSLLKL